MIWSIIASCGVWLGGYALGRMHGFARAEELADVAALLGRTAGYEAGLSVRPQPGETTDDTIRRYLRGAE